jgi:hypothetical protein
LPFSDVIFQFVLIVWSRIVRRVPEQRIDRVATFIDLIAKWPSAWSKVMAAVNTAALGATFGVQVLVMRGAQQYQKISGVPENMQRMVTPKL